LRKSVTELYESNLIRVFTVAFQSDDIREWLLMFSSKALISSSK
jgi:hypothetical protein